MSMVYNTFMFTLSPKPTEFIFVCRICKKNLRLMYFNDRVLLLTQRMRLEALGCMLLNSKMCVASIFLVCSLFCIEIVLLYLDLYLCAEGVVCL